MVTEPGYGTLKNLYLQSHILKSIKVYESIIKVENKYNPDLYMNEYLSNEI
jgi:hypothetical protein